MGDIPAPGIHLAPGPVMLRRAAERGVSVCEREAQFGRNPWVGASARLKVRKGVMVGMSVCA